MCKSVETQTLAKKSMIHIYTKQKEFLLEPPWALYIETYLIDFLNKNRLDGETIITIDRHVLPAFYDVISEALSDLLNMNYSEPSEKALQKYLTRYEKIYLNNKVFRVNYRMSINGRMAFALFCLMKFIENAEMQSVDIQIAYS